MCAPVIPASPSSLSLFVPWVSVRFPDASNDCTFSRSSSFFLFLVPFPQTINVVPEDVWCSKPKEEKGVTSNCGIKMYIGQQCTFSCGPQYTKDPDSPTWQGVCDIDHGKETTY